MLGAVTILRSMLLAAFALGAAVRAFAQLPAESATPPANSTFPYLNPEDAPRFSAPPRNYAPPEGFSGYGWGTLRSAFTNLPAQAAGVRAAWTQGKRMGDELFCTGRGLEKCTEEDLARVAMNNHYEGDGFHVLSEYYNESQGFRFPASGVVMYPVVYQFCANWHGMAKKVPVRFEEINKFCGMRMLFDSETRAQVRGLPPDHVTQYDLVLSELMARYGRPEKFSMRGRVVVESADDPVDAARREDRKFSSWRWCPAPRDGLETRCAASIVLAIDLDIGRGVVLFSTPALWEYAHARESIGEDVEVRPPDPLYTPLHGLPMNVREAERQRILADQRAAQEKEAARIAAKQGKADAKKSRENSALPQN